MFIQKDTRKVREILRDPDDPRTSLKLARREAEFGGNTKVLCEAGNEEALKDTQYLSLYGNKLTKLSRFEVACSAPLTSLNLARNLLTTIPPVVSASNAARHLTFTSTVKPFPMQVGTMSSTMQHLWLDDNLLPEFPAVSALCSAV